MTARDSKTREKFDEIVYDHVHLRIPILKLVFKPHPYN